MQAAEHGRDVLSYTDRLSDQQAALQARAMHTDPLSSPGVQLVGDDATQQQADKAALSALVAGGEPEQRAALPMAAELGSTEVGRPSMTNLTCASAGATSSAGMVLSFSKDDNRLAIGRNTGPHGRPFPVSRAPPLLRYVAAGGHSIVVDVDGALWTWGRNDSSGGGGFGSPPMQGSGQLGDGRRMAPSPREAAPLVTADAFVAADAGRYHSAAVTTDGRVLTWGLNDFGQLGRSAQTADGLPCTSGATCHSALLEAAQGSDAAFATEEVVAVAAGRYHTVVATRSGAVYTSGLNFCGHGQVWYTQAAFV